MAGGCESLFSGSAAWDGDLIIVELDPAVCLSPALSGRNQCQVGWKNSIDTGPNPVLFVAWYIGKPDGFRHSRHSFRSPRRTLP